MTKLISGARLISAVTEQTFIMDGDPRSVENVKYDFHMGSRLLKAALGQPVEYSEVPPDKRFVDPGEVVFVLTKERLCLPSNIIATLTPKRKLAHGGIIILGGLAVDPLYRGVLLVGLYNFSSTPFPLMPGKKLIGAMFYELDPEDVHEDTPTPKEINDFPDELVALIRNYHPIELNSLGDRVAEISRELNNLRSELISDKEWREEFKSSLDQHNNQLGLLIKGLEDERDVRQTADDKLRDKLESMSNMFFGLRLGWAIVAAFALALLGAAVGPIVTEWLK